VGAVSRRRRVLDVVVAGTALVLLLPVLVAAAVAVRLSGPGPVIFRQQRLTRGSVPFTMFKFRTMCVGTGGPEVTRNGDPRITRAGALLRRTSIDELPQLVNVLRGEMTLVGPRPETPALGARYPADLRWVLEHTPGLTGPAQITLRDDVAVAPPSRAGRESGSGATELEDVAGEDTHHDGDDLACADLELWYLERLVPRRVAADWTYLRRPSLGATLLVLVMTARYLVTGRSPRLAPDGS
jgi:lipopolysaccharide/colanic/teichoic acid biosynthesis glycosyltransferase